MSPQLFDFTGKVALVTGGASGIGAAVVTLLRRLGASVCVADIAGNAGAADTSTPTLERDVSNWRRIVDADLPGTYLMCRCVGRHMVQRRHGSIANISSIVGLGGLPRRNAYGASKAGVIMLTRSLACEWGRANVRVNCIAPGYIRTPMVDALVTAGKVHEQRVNGRTPIGRMGDPLEIAQAVAYPSSDWASFVTGTTLAVDGGWSAFGGAGDVATA